MTTVHMICGRYFDIEKKCRTIGGIQSYIFNLCNVIREMGMSCKIYQTYLTNDKYEDNNVEIIQSQVDPTIKDLKKIKVSYKRCMENFDFKNDILIFTTDSRIVKNNVKNSIAIQHGICWDIPRHQNKSAIFNSLYTFNRSRQAFRILERLRKVNNVICVDYNFLNWYRTVAAYEAINLRVIPNFTNISPRIQKPNNRINIIFARRLEIYRGTRLFAEAILKILKEYNNVYITIAGSGPDEDFMKSKLALFNERVEFIKYSSEQSLQIHSDKHIAVIPTIGSEGTSLSLLEAMSSQCAVISSNVGGMTNIIIDKYNGLMISPKVDELYKAIATLINDEKMRMMLANRAYETVINGFSYDKWKEAWISILNNVK